MKFTIAEVFELRFGNDEIAQVNICVDLLVRLIRRVTTQMKFNYRDRSWGEMILLLTQISVANGLAKPRINPQNLHFSAGS